MSDALPLLFVAATALLMPAAVLCVYHFDARLNRPYALCSLIAVVQFAAYFTMVSPLEIGGDYRVPLSILIFPAGLIVLFLAYVKKATYEFRSICRYGVLVPQLILITVVFGMSLYNRTSTTAVLPEWFRFTSLALMVCGLVALILDVLLIVRIYDGLQATNRPFIRIFVPLLASLLVDALLISTALRFLDSEVYKDFGRIVAVQLLGKAISAMVYAAALRIYAFVYEPDLFLDVPARPHGLEFLDESILRHDENAALPDERLRVIPMTSAKDFFLQLDTLLGLAYLDDFTPVGVYAFSHATDSPTSATCVDQVTRGRFFGLAFDFEKCFVLVVHGAEEKRLRSLRDELSRCFPSSACDYRIYPVDGERGRDALPSRAMRHSATHFLADLLTENERSAFVESKVSPTRDQVLLTQYRIILNRWSELTAKHAGRFVAFCDGELIGHDKSKHELGYLYITQERPYSRFVIVRIDEEYREFLASQFPAPVPV